MSVASSSTFEEQISDECKLVSRLSRPTIDLSIRSIVITFAEIHEATKQLEGKYGFESPDAYFLVRPQSLDNFKGKLSGFDPAQCPQSDHFKGYYRIEEGTENYNLMINSDSILYVPDLYSVTSDAGDLRFFSIHDPAPDQIHEKSLTGVFWMADDTPKLMAEIVCLLHPNATSELADKAEKAAQVMTSRMKDHINAVAAAQNLPQLDM